MLPYGYQSINSGDIEAVIEVLGSEWLTTGPKVAAFEAAVAAFVGGCEVVTCTSGTAALHTALTALGISPGDEVIVPAMTFVASASTATLLGANVVFADVDPSTGNISTAHLQELLTERTKAVVTVDFAGRPCDYDTVNDAAASVGARVLADAAHSFGGSYRQRAVGTLADATVTSFFPTKNLTTGEGGAILTADSALATRAAEFRSIGLVRDPTRFELSDEGPWHQEVQEFGLNYRLTDIASALGLSQLRRLPAFKGRRQEIKERYDEALGEVDAVRIPPTAPDSDPAWHLYPLRVLGGRRREVYEKMRLRGIGVQVNYLPVYWHPAYKKRGYRRGLCPHAEGFYAEELSLPMFPDLTDSRVDLTIDALLRTLS